MSNDVNYLELVRQAQLGSEESMSELIQLVKGRLFAYIYRLTLNYDLAEEFSQETMLKMLESLKRLKFEHVNQFWGWLYRTALGRVQLYFRKQRNKQMVEISGIDEKYLSQHTPGDYGDGLKKLINKELSNVIFAAMEKLKLRHRTVLVLRCFEQMRYSEIADVMECSETAAQILFFRAKHSLKRQLSRRGFSKKYLLIALGWFARATAPVEAASTPITVTAAATKVGIAATIIGAVGTKVGVVATTAITATALTVGGITMINNEPSFYRDSDTEFRYPISLIAAYDADNSGWEGRGIEGSGFVVPEQLLVGPPPSSMSAVSLPTEHWVELKFPGTIVNGPGDDIIVVEWGRKDETAQVFITDGDGNEYLLGIARAKISPPPSVTEINFDISGISLPFEPCAVRIVGMDERGEVPGFELCSVRARTKPD